MSTKSSVHRRQEKSEHACQMPSEIPEICMAAALRRVNHPDSRALQNLITLQMQAQTDVNILVV
jgi:hypothetical protein